MNRADFEAAARFKEALDAAMRQRLDNYISAYAKADANDAREQAYGALVTALQHAKMAAPDYLWQVDVDEAAALILDRFPPSSPR